MQPLTSSEYAALAAADDFDAPVDFARAIGNHKVA